MQLIVNDVAGNFQTKTLAHMYCQKADCILLCYDLTRRLTFEGLEDWLEAIGLDECGKTLPIALVATKSDLATSQRAIKKNIGQMKKEEIGANCFLFQETTTYTNNVEPINNLFAQIAEKVIADRLRRAAS